MLSIECTLTVARYIVRVFPFFQVRLYFILFTIIVHLFSDLLYDHIASFLIVLPSLLDVEDVLEYTVHEHSPRHAKGYTSEVATEDSLQSTK